MKNNRVLADILQAPAHPLTGRAIWKTMREALFAERGYKQTLERIAGALGTSISTTGYWLGAHTSQQVLSFILLLEYLSETERFRLLHELCRPLPSLLHSRFASSASTVADLLEVLKQPQGLTVIRGKPDFWRTFIASALGHTFPQIDSQHRLPCGLDIHQPDKLVPVEGVFYVSGSADLVRLPRAIDSVWPEIQASNSPLLIFNGVWSRMPSHRAEILDWAAHRHVIIADSEVPGPTLCAQHQIPEVQLFDVEPQKNHATRLCITHESIATTRRNKSRRNKP